MRAGRDDADDDRDARLTLKEGEAGIDPGGDVVSPGIFFFFVSTFGSRCEREWGMSCEVV